MKDDEVRKCSNCLHAEKGGLEMPCSHCFTYGTKWEPKACAKPLEAYKILRDVTEYAARAHCLHENARKGGLAGEMGASCDPRSAKTGVGIWACDVEYPAPIQNALAFLDKLVVQGGRSDGLEKAYLEWKQDERDRVAWLLGLK